MASERPVVVELAGLAGAGKSTLASALARLDPTIRARPRVSEGSYLASVPALVPTFLRLHWPFRGVLTKEMKRMLRVQTLHRLVRETTRGDTLLFDEGPVYMLSRILMFGADNLRSRAFERWWRAAIAGWATTLDVVIWLDAPDDVLAARLHTRAQRHPLQGAHDEAVSAFFTGYRAAFSRVVSELCLLRRGAQLWNITTDAGSADRTAHTILDRLRALRGTVSPALEMA